MHEKHGVKISIVLHFAQFCMCRVDGPTKNWRGKHVAHLLWAFIDLVSCGVEGFRVDSGLLGGLLGEDEIRKITQNCISSGLGTHNDIIMEMELGLD